MFLQENVDAEKEQLRIDTEKLLEGKVCECLFERQFLSEEHINSSDAWWVGNIKRENFIERFFFLQLNKPGAENEVDKRVCSMLSAVPNYFCFYVYAIGEDWYFGRFDSQEKDMDESSFVAKYNLKKRKPCSAAMVDAERQEKCISFLEKNGELRKVALARKFANSFLWSRFDSIGDLDYIVLQDDCLKIYEIKWKNTDFWGINIGEKEVLQELNLHGFEIEMVMFINRIPIQKRNPNEKSIFDYLEHGDNKDWVMGNVDFFVKLTENDLRSNKQNFDKTGEQKYFSIEAYKNRFSRKEYLSVYYDKLTQLISNRVNRYAIRDIQTKEIVLNSTTKNGFTSPEKAWKLFDAYVINGTIKNISRSDVEIFILNENKV